MEIYIIRHGKAEVDSNTGMDFDRVLKKKGHKQAQWLADWIAERSPKPELVLSSPYARAKETAPPIWEVLGMEAQIDDRLGAERSLSDYFDVLEDAKGSSCVALVGHNPTCARAVTSLCTGLMAMPGGHRTGELAHVRIDRHDLFSGAELVERARMGED